MSAPRLSLDIKRETWPLKTPFRITGRVFTEMPLVVAILTRQGRQGRGEAAGVYYLDDGPDEIEAALEVARAAIEADPGREAVQELLPPGGARNALDCAYWDLESALSGQPAWRLAGLERPRPLLTTFTIGAGEPAEMAEAARRWTQACALKLKLTGQLTDIDRVRAVREARPDVWIGVDANQGYDREGLEAVLPLFEQAGVSLVEQPLPRGEEAQLAGLNSPIPLAADESVQSLPDIERVAGLVDVINIKLDKCGGLTEGLAMVRGARAAGLDVMVGNMVGTALSTAPASLLGQLCDRVDLDGPFLLSADRSPPTAYENGTVFCPAEIWGGAEADRPREAAL